MSVKRTLIPLIIGLAILALFASSAFAASECSTCKPWWHLHVGSRPTLLPAETGEKGEMIVTATNLGDAFASGETSPVTITAVVPGGLTAKSITGIAGESIATGNRGPVTCTKPPLLSCSFKGTLPPFDEIEIRIVVEVSGEGPLPDATSEVSVSGGGALPATLSHPVVTSSEPTPFGLENYELAYEDGEAGGAAITQAGSHPFQQTVTLDINQAASTSIGGIYYAHPVALPKDVKVALPPGLVGNPVPFPTCSLAEFLHAPPTNPLDNECKPDTAVGVAAITFDEPNNLHLFTRAVPVFNLEPAFGEPVRFGFLEPYTPVLIDTAVRSGPGEDYGVTASTSNITQLAALSASQVTLWGVPGDPRHNNARGWGCIEVAREEPKPGEPCSIPPANPHPPALLTLPTACSGPLHSGTEIDSWAREGELLAPLPSTPLQALDGCNQLLFAPTISSEPSTDRASAPSGLDVNINFHDEGLLNSEGTAQSQLKDTVVTLPEGFTINPSAGVGLGGCTPADYAAETLNSAPGAGCPNDSKLGTVEIETPLLTQKIQGSLFIAQPYENPFPEPEAGHPNGTLVALYIVAKNPETGVLIKLAGKVSADPVTGRLTTSFENNPQLPFDHFNFHFREGQQAPLISPPACGTYTTQAQLTPWSEPTTSLTDTSSFTITKGYDGGECPSGGVPPFHPAIQSGMLNNNAGAFSPFYLHLTRTDGEQEISGFSTNLPEGLTGDLSGIPFCGEAQIALARTKTGSEEEANPSCPAQSQIGHTLVGTGVGAVLAYVPGKIYLAGPFHGAPFSLVAVTSAVVGPFDLGTVVLRFGLSIDPYTAQVSVSPTSSEPIPTILKGIVTHVRDIRVYIDRNDFTLNPTSCNPLAIGSTLNSNLGAGTTVTSPFQAASCANLKFAPKFAVSTSGKTSRAKGASLAVKLTYPNAPQGSQANIARVKVDLPKQLPSRLTTLQKACTAAQFNTNPAGCPAASFIGHAKAVTPLIPVPLEGPAIFVSHGGEAFPSLIMVLQGYGVTIDLVGSTFISKSGITSSTFKTVPDQPVGSFELTLPEGKYSALAANGNLCTSKLAMPTEFVAQNGAKINESTNISVTGCSIAISIVSHKIKGRTLTVSVSVPAAGILTASGKGLSASSKSAKGRETLTFKLTQKQGGKLSTKLKIAFKPSKGSKQARSLSVKFKR
jgi:hypothetical protein